MWMAWNAGKVVLFRLPSAIVCVFWRGQLVKLCFFAFQMQPSAEIVCVDGVECR